MRQRKVTSHWERVSLDMKDDANYRKRIIFDAVIIIFVSLVTAVVLLMAVGYIKSL